MAEEKKDKKERFGNCGGCAKPIKKVRRYYRNSKYFCAERCYKDYLRKTSESKDKNVEAQI